MREWKGEGDREGGFEFPIIVDTVEPWKPSGKTSKCLLEVFSRGDIASFGEFAPGTFVRVQAPVHDIRVHCSTAFAGNSSLRITQKPIYDGVLDRISYGITGFSARRVYCFTAESPPDGKTTNISPKTVAEPCLSLLPRQRSLDEITSLNKNVRNGFRGRRGQMHRPRTHF